MKKNEIKAKLLLERNVQLNLTKEQYDDEEIVLLLIEHNKTNHFKKISDRLKDNNDIVRKLVSSDWENFKYASDRLKSDKDFILSFLPKEHFILKYINKDLFLQEDFVYSILKNPNTLRYLDEKIRNKDCYINEAIKNNHKDILYGLNDETILNTEKLISILRKLADKNLLNKNSFLEKFLFKDQNLKLWLNPDIKEIIEKNFSIDEQLKMKEKISGDDIIKILHYFFKNEITELVEITEKKAKKVKF